MSGFGPALEGAGAMAGGATQGMAMGQQMSMRQAEAERWRAMAALQEQKLKAETTPFGQGGANLMAGGFGLDPNDPKNSQTMSYLAGLNPLQAQGMNLPGMAGLGIKRGELGVHQANVAQRARDSVLRLYDIESKNTRSDAEREALWQRMVAAQESKYLSDTSGFRAGLDPASDAAIRQQFTDLKTQHAPQIDQELAGRGQTVGPELEDFFNAKAGLRKPRGGKGQPNPNPAPAATAAPGGATSVSPLPQRAAERAFQGTVDDFDQAFKATGQ